ncbi:MAG TPA: efflux RND transporter periplasmic adaptor subunit [bacterium]|nr:efflux RND transporter periplasmic adaptor subunit [bacterium]
MRKLWWVLGVLIICGGAYWWHSTRSQSAPGDEIFKRTAVARRGDMVVSISATGRIDPIEKVEVKSKASGEIIELPIEEGDVVRRGDLIARLDRRTAQNDYDQAQADYSVAEVTVRQRERELKRLQTLFENKLASESELDNAKLAYEQANSSLVRTKAALSTAEERLRDTEIRSPIDGIIIERPVEIGQIISSGTTTVTGGTLLCTVANMQQVYVVASVDETDIGKVSVGMPAFITPDAYPDKRLRGTVERIAPKSKVEQNVTVFEVTSLVDNAEGLLKSGMNSTVEVVTNQAEDAILLPVRAVEYRTPPAPTSGDTARTGLRAEGTRGPGDTAGGHRRFERGAGGPSTGGGGTQMVMMQGGPGGTTMTRTQSGRATGIPMVQVRRHGVDQWVPVKTGLSNVDDIQILEGVAEGDTVVYSLSSGAMQQRAEMMERMRNNTAIPGMRRTN